MLIGNRDAVRSRSRGESAALPNRNSSTRRRMPASDPSSAGGPAGGMPLKRSCTSWALDSGVVPKSRNRFNSSMSGMLTVDWISSPRSSASTECPSLWARLFIWSVNITTSWLDLLVKKNRWGGAVPPVGPGLAIGTGLAWPARRSVVPRLRTLACRASSSRRAAATGRPAFARLRRKRNRNYPAFLVGRHIYVDIGREPAVTAVATSAAGASIAAVAAVAARENTAYHFEAIRAVAAP